MVKPVWRIRLRKKVSFGKGVGLEPQQIFVRGEWPALGGPMGRAEPRTKNDRILTVLGCPPIQTRQTAPVSGSVRWAGRVLRQRQKDWKCGLVVPTQQLPEVVLLPGNASRAPQSRGEEQSR